ncbi:MAG: hypothetical protein AAF962_22100 [Actinomycetota bacterium]
MELHLFEHAGELVRAMAAERPGGGDTAAVGVRFRSHRRGVKVWFGPEKPTRFHYEAQVLPARLLDRPPAEGLAAIEVGFHAEHGDDRRNRAVVDHLDHHRSTWTSTLGEEAELGPFIGNDNWARLSEVWPGEDLDDPDLAFELAGRLVDYVEAVEPLLDSLE